MSKKKIRGVIKGLNKASKLHAKQARTLKTIVKQKPTKKVT
tara:strand:+ start:537 stop:659 length:123 start_codon:yes stop_codon:yes gene_type:complete